MYDFFKGSEREVARLNNKFTKVSPSEVFLSSSMNIAKKVVKLISEATEKVGKKGGITVEEAKYPSMYYESGLIHRV